MSLAVDGVVAINLAVSLFADVQVLGDAGQVEFLVVVADAAGDLAIFRKGVVKLEADDAASSGGAFVSPEPVSENPEGILSVVVVTVDDSERLVDDILGHQHGVGGSPRLLPLRIEGEL